ncbi:hypothetical protein HUT19_41905 (plasmid) [Streptomyces sp. NA02950]|uniref:hypothetical protein n=1 Tax=Streptomyces sp. NA02950 TaxID=2742137 RepID=UPI001590C33B|nr:hypothetical protein [Streptomyces sp. NA02950]QKV98275.1 hypothetical protein HUT19_41905 [Streptomyces sp. NA02950]
MTVTFTAAHRPPVGYAVSCCCPQATVLAPRFGSYPDAQDAADRANAAPGPRDPLPGCDLPEICPEYPLYAEEVDPDGEVPFVEFSNTNVVGVLEALGFPLAADAGTACDALEAGLPLEVPDDAVVIPVAVVDAHGQLGAGDFRARVLTALGLAPEDPGVPDLRLGRTVVCGRAPGYLQRRLRELYELADWCAAHGREVAWH